MGRVRTIQLSDREREPGALGCCMASLWNGPRGFSVSPPAAIPLNVEPRSEAVDPCGPGAIGQVLFRGVGELVLHSNESPADDFKSAEGVRSNISVSQRVRRLLTG